MKKTLCVLLLSILCACATGADRGADADSGASAATARWRDAYNSRDPVRIVAMYDHDAVLWGTTAKKIASDPAAIADYFKGAPSRPNARVTFGEEHLRVYGDVAFSSGYYTFSDVREGKATSRPARYTMVFRNRDGKWLIVAHHSSEVPN